MHKIFELLGNEKTIKKTINKDYGFVEYRLLDTREFFATYNPNSNTLIFPSGNKILDVNSINDSDFIAKILSLKDKNTIEIGRGYTAINVSISDDILTCKLENIFGAITIRKSLIKDNIIIIIKTKRIATYDTHYDIFLDFDKYKKCLKNMSFLT